MHQHTLKSIYQFSQKKTTLTMDFSGIDVFGSVTRKDFQTMFEFPCKDLISLSTYELVYEFTATAVIIFFCFICLFINI